MEKTYAQALMEVIRRGIAPKKAVERLYEVLQMHGRAMLMPRIAKEFARIAERARSRTDVALFVTREKDERKAKGAIKAILADMGAKPADVSVRIDDSLIGGWRLEGRETLVDASFKKYLLEMYNRSTA